MKACPDCKVPMEAKVYIHDPNPENCSCCSHYLAVILQCPKCKTIEVE